jgi:hypothetical protein
MLQNVHAAYIGIPKGLGYECQFLFAVVMSMAILNARFNFDEQFSRRGIICGVTVCEHEERWGWFCFL